MIDPTSRVGRQVAASALAVACVLVGPRADLVAALERVYAVAVVEDERDRRRDRAPSADQGPRGPGNRRPAHARPRGRVR